LKQFNFKRFKLPLLFSLVIALMMVVCSPALAEVSIEIGPTKILNGSALGANDITLSNEYMAVSFAVDTPNAWNMDKGSILDVAPVVEGKWGIDKVFDVEFLMDQWTTSAVSYPVEVFIEKNTSEEGVVVAKRQFNQTGKAPLDITVTYTLPENSKELTIVTEVYNPGVDAYTGLYSGYSLSKEAGFMTGPFGYPTPDVKVKRIHISELYGQYVACYDSDFAVGLHMEDPDHYTGTTGYKDLYQLTTINPGETKVYKGYLQVETVGSLAPIVESAISKKGADEPFGIVSGKVSVDGEAISNPVVVVEREGRYADKDMEMQTFCWAVGDATGNYSVKLPVGEYRLYAVARNYSPSSCTMLEVMDQDEIICDFTDLNPAGIVFLKAVDAETKEPVNARIEVKGGTKPVVRYLGVSTYFTELDNPGYAEIPLAGGKYDLVVSSGGGFVAENTIVPVEISSLEKKQIEAEIKPLIVPSQEYWYCADLHHHSDQADGATSPLDLVRSQLSSRLDFTFVSDHDSVINHQEIAEISDKKKIPFIPSLEVSPGWSHFNILPYTVSKPIDPNQTATQIFKEAHDQGFLVVANHPYTSYGYFYNKDKIPGGYDPDFDFIELQPTMDISVDDNSDKMTLDDAMKFWNEALNGKSKVYYLTGGTDTHDVLSNLYSGLIRSYVYVKGEPDPAQFLDALKQGHSYVTMGPLIFPKQMFGNTYVVPENGSFKLDFDLIAVDGLKRVDIYSEGKVVDSRIFDNSRDRETLSFELKPTGPTWYSIVAIDSKGAAAISNPLWIAIESDIVRDHKKTGGPKGGVSKVSDQLELQKPASDAAETTDGTESGVEEKDSSAIPGLEVDFHDLDSVPWAKDQILSLASRGVISGKAPGVFDPKTVITRAEFAVLIAKGLQLEGSSNNLPFSDVGKEAWYYDGVALAFDNGLFSGKSSSIFEPLSTLTRQEMAVVFAKVLLARGCQPGDEGDLTEFIDHHLIAPWARSAVATVCKEGIAFGVGDGRFAPTASVTRAESAVMLYNLINKLEIGF